jgi:predicted oxidoreductase
MYKIATPPFYAATVYPVWHDSYGGLRINGRAQVIDMQGEPIPGLYAGGESSGGGNQHGLGRALCMATSRARTPPERLSDGDAPRVGRLF